MVRRRSRHEGSASVDKPESRLHKMPIPGTRQTTLKTETP